MRRPEQLLQRQVAAWLNLAYPGLLWWHTPNGGARSKVEAGILKSMGVKAGVPDLTLILPLGLAAFIELKAGRNGLTAAQEAFRDRAKSLGCFFADARTLAEVEGILDAWLLPFGWVSKARLAA